jgi:hypothetical protein
MDRAMKQIVSSTTRVKAGNGQAAAAGAEGRLRAGVHSQHPQRHPGRDHVGARVYADIQTRRHTLGMPLPPYVADALTAMAHGANCDGARRVCC